MNCVVCSTQMRTIMYEGIEIDTCEGCGAEFLDGDELGKIIEIREIRFNPEERRAIAESATIRGVPVQRSQPLSCPGCGWPMEHLNYGGGSGLFLDKCTGCGGFWLDNAELEKVQMIVEGWQDLLPEDLARYGTRLRYIAEEVDRNDDVTVSRLPVVGRFLNACVNGILDLGR